MKLTTSRQSPVFRARTRIGSSAREKWFEVKRERFMLHVHSEGDSCRCSASRSSTVVATGNCRTDAASMSREFQSVGTGLACRAPGYAGHRDSNDGQAPPGVWSISNRATCSCQLVHLSFCCSKRIVSLFGSGCILECCSLCDQGLLNVLLPFEQLAAI
jgi:hypothetical protein